MTTRLLLAVLVRTTLLNAYLVGLMLWTGAAITADEGA